MNSKGEIGIKGCFEVLSLFFVLAVTSVIMIYGKFEQGVEDFWENTVYEDTVQAENDMQGAINVDSIETSGGVSDFYKDELTLEYIEQKGEIDVFSTIFELYRQE